MSFLLYTAKSCKLVELNHFRVQGQGKQLQSLGLILALFRSLRCCTHNFWSNIIAIEEAHIKGWSRLWIESDSHIAIQTSKSHGFVPWDLHNRWSNCFASPLRLLFSYVFREDNTRVDKLVVLGHDCHGFTWWDSLLTNLYGDFFKDRCNLLNYRFS